MVRPKERSWGKAMRAIMQIIVKYVAPWFWVTTYFPRMIMRGASRFLFNVFVGGNLVLSIILMATVFPYCVIALFFARDTTPYWNGIGFSLFTVAWTLIVFAVVRVLAKMRDRARGAIDDFCRRNQTGQP
jgi:hypothetical protein